MKVACSATVQEAMQLKNLCTCVRILGGVPIKVGKGTIEVTYEGTKEKVDKFIELFSHYTEHQISIKA